MNPIVTKKERAMIQIVTKVLRLHKTKEHERKRHTSLMQRPLKPDSSS